MMAENQATMMSNDMQSNQASTTVSYRRNGKLFSCEPCRKGKLRCDHNSPICGRCARRNKPDQCVYHPAPLTKQRSSPETAPFRTSEPPSSTHSYRASPYPTARTTGGLASPRSSNSASAGVPDFKSSGNAAASIPTSVMQSPTTRMAHNPTPDGRTSSSISYTTPESSVSFKDSRTGFLGPTAYSAVFTENSDGLIVLKPDLNAEEDPNPLPPLQIPDEKVQSGVDVLRILRDMPLYRRFTDRWLDLADGLAVRPALRIWIDEMWKEFGGIIVEGNEEQLRDLSRLIWRNTRRPVRTHGQMTAREWSMNVTGKNLRWEIVGTVLSLIGLVAINMSNWDTMFDDLNDLFVDRATFAERMRKASEYCLCFCYECEVLNDFYIYLVFHDLVLLECFKGDAHYAVWQRTGEVCDTVVAMGLHQGNPVDAETPFFLSHMRKKLFMHVYCRDKTVASFLGRPPRLSYRYCKMEMPLDISEELLFAEDGSLEATIATLDREGWSTSANLSRHTWNRMWFQECRIREEILEMALGSDGEDIEQQASGISLRLGLLHASFPDRMKVHPQEILDRSDASFGRAMPQSRRDIARRQLDALVAICVHAGFMQTEFLLQRALVNRHEADTKSLIPVAREILKIVLLAQAHSDYFRDYQGDMVYLLSMHGLPSAGVLAIELLKQEQSRQYTSDLLPRSETIQDLCVFISALGAVGPGAGNYNICNQGRRAVKRVVDQILSPSAPPIPGVTEQTPADDMSLYFPTGNDADFLQWLENVEWDKGLMNTIS